MPCEFLPLPANQADTALVEQFQEKLDTPSRTLIGGFSLGARIAAMVSLVTPVAGLVGLSFPFHRHGQPLERHGLETLRAVSVNTLLIQGTRDSHGNEAQVRGMGPLPPQVQIVWLADANHRWHSRGAQTPEDHANDAVLAIQSFADGLVSRPYV
jgi:predicted alpha/beta-hydrolase family hydrolase